MSFPTLGLKGYRGGHITGRQASLIHVIDVLATVST